MDNYNKFFNLKLKFKLIFIYSLSFLLLNFIFVNEIISALKKNYDMSNEKNRFSDSELEEFKLLIQNKLLEANDDYKLLIGSLSHADDHGTDDTGRSFNMMEDGSETLSREEVAQLAARQEKFIQSLQAALVRIQNKTYGICRINGKLIPKERLRLVPHATMSIDAKNAQK